MNNDKPASESVAALSKEDRKRIHILACDIEYNMDNDTTTVQLCELGDRITKYERAKHGELMEKLLSNHNADVENLLAENERLKQRNKSLQERWENENNERIKLMGRYDHAGGVIEDLQSKNAKLREALEAIIEAGKDFNTDSDMVLNIIDTTAKAALTTTPKP